MQKTKYIQIYEKYRNDITNGNYEYGSFLPSKRVTADDFSVSLVSVEHAYDLLIEEGYINPIQRKGYQIIYQKEDFFPIEEVETFHNAEIMIEPDLFPFSVYAKAIRKVLSEYGDELLVKRENQGLLELREAITKYLARSRNIHVQPDQIVIVPGAERAYSLIVAMLGRSRIYGIESPSYQKIQAMYQSEGVRIDLLKMGKKGILSKELQRTPASILHVTPFNSYPTNVTADASKRQAYIQWAIKKDAYIVEDDYASEYNPISKSADTLFSLEPNKHVIYLNSFTKTIGPAIRISYVILPKEKKEELLSEIKFMMCGVSSISQLVIANILNDGSFERHLNKVKRSRKKK